MEDLDLDEEYQEAPPPSPVDVARRALILSAVVCRASIENYKDEKYKRETAATIREWFDELELWPHLEPDEDHIIRAELGTLPRRLIVSGTWFVEGLAILTWALRRGEFPPHDRKVDPIAVTDALNFLSPDADAILAAPGLRPAQELDAAREWFYDVHCILRCFLFHKGDGHLASWIGNYVAILGFDPKVVMAGQGLAYAGQPLTAADREQLEVWENVICQRHRASLWLVGTEEPYTEISVDT